MPGISEQLLQAMEIIANNSVKNLNFDQTKTYTIQENLGDGSYIVTDGSVTFTAYSSASYKVGETVYINRMKATEIGGIEQFRNMLDYAQAGDNVGLLLRGVDRNDVSRGDILTK